MLLVDSSVRTPAMLTSVAPSLAWYATGREWFAAILEAIDRARCSIDVEFYVWSPGQLADRLGAAMARAAGRGCQVRVLLDAFGSEGAQLTFGEMAAAGVQLEWFNPRRLTRLSFRNHRKLVVIDAGQAFVGGCNVADEYDGDGIEQGWRDLGVCVHEPECVATLARSFAHMWELAPFDHLPTAATMPQAGHGADWELFFAGAGRGGRRYRRRLHRDLARARSIDVLAAYFVPTTRLRKLLAGVARRGQVRIIVPAAGDVALAHHASAHVLEGLAQTAIRAYEYLPAMLHAKLVVADDVVYLGSANFDPRSLRINFDLMLRIEDAGVATQARAIVDQIQQHARPFRSETPRLLTRVYRRFAYVALAWLDPLIARRKLRLLA